MKSDRAGSELLIKTYLEELHSRRDRGEAAREIGVGISGDRKLEKVEVKQHPEFRWEAGMHGPRRSPQRS